MTPQAEPLHIQVPTKIIQEQKKYPGIIEKPEKSLPVWPVYLESITRVHGGPKATNHGDPSGISKKLDLGT